MPTDHSSAMIAALRRFKRQSGLPVSTLARALGMHRSELSPSHLGSRPYLLSGCLHRNRLPAVAKELRLDLVGFQALEELAATVHGASSGFSIPRQTWANGPEEAAHCAELAEHLFLTNAWSRAAPLAEHALKVLMTKVQSPRDAAFQPLLRAGTTRIDWLTFQGRFTDAVGVARELGRVTRDCGQLEPTAQYALGLFYKASAVASNHQGLEHPRYTVRIARAAYDRLSRADLEPLSRAAVLRDQAKPYAHWALGFGKHNPDPHRWEDVDGVLDAADRETGGNRPEDDKRLEWTYNQCTRVVCSSVRGAHEVALRRWDRLQEQPWLDCLIRDPSAKGLAPALAFTRMALSLARGDFEELGDLARQFIYDPDTSDYREKRLRAKVMQEAGERGDGALLRKCFLR